MVPPTLKLLELVTTAQFYLCEKYPQAQIGDKAIYRGAEFSRNATSGALRWRFEAYVDRHGEDQASL